MSDTESKQPQRVEVITSGQRRRRWSVAEKIRIVQECELRRDKSTPQDAAAS